MIRRTAGTGTPQIKWINSDNAAAGFTATEYNSSNSTDTFGPTIFGHNGTDAAQTLGAVPFNNSATVESFSARGPVTHLFGPVVGNAVAAPLGAPQVLQKPDVSATDGGINTFFGGGHRFFGTSASTPHAAAVGALQMEANPALTAAQVNATQVATATPIPGFGTNIGGAGLVNAQAAIASEPAGGADRLGRRPGAEQRHDADVHVQHDRRRQDGGVLGRRRGAGAVLLAVHDRSARRRRPHAHGHGNRLLRPARHRDGDGDDRRHGAEGRHRQGPEEERHQDQGQVQDQRPTPTRA